MIWTSKPTTLYFSGDNGNGLDAPWGFGAITAYSNNVKGRVQAHHFLADKNYPADCTKVWCIEKDDTIQVLFYEFIDRTGSSAGSAWTNNDSFKWDVQEFKIKGANQLAFAATALLAALSVLSF